MIFASLWKEFSKRMIPLKPTAHLSNQSLVPGMGNSNGRLNFLSKNVIRYEIPLGYEYLG